VLADLVGATRAQLLIALLTLGSSSAPSSTPPVPSTEFSTTSNRLSTAIDRPTAQPFVFR